MRAGLLFLSVLLAMAFAAMPTVVAQAENVDQPEGFLYAHWPDEAVPGANNEIPMDTSFPAGEPDLSSGMAAPGTTAAMGNAPVPTWTYFFVNETGAQGPPSELVLDSSQDAHLVVYLSADQTAVPTAVPLPPEQNPDYGVAPMVTVEATLSMGGEVVGVGSQTQTMVSTPMQVVYQYNVPIEFDVERVAAGSGIEVTVQLYQIDSDGERAMQNMWNINTGEMYPTGLHIPATNPDALAGIVEVDEPLNLTSSDDEDTDDTPVPALLAPLALAIALIAARRRD